MTTIQRPGKRREERPKKPASLPQSMNQGSTMRGGERERVPQNKEGRRKRREREKKRGKCIQVIQIEGKGSTLVVICLYLLLVSRFDD